MAELRALRMAGSAAGIHLNGAMLAGDGQRGIVPRLCRKPFGIARPAAVPAIERYNAAHRLQVLCDRLHHRVEIGADEQKLRAGGAARRKLTGTKTTSALAAPNQSSKNAGTFFDR